MDMSQTNKKLLPHRATQLKQCLSYMLISYAGVWLLLYHVQKIESCSWCSSSPMDNPSLDSFDERPLPFRSYETIAIIVCRFNNFIRLSKVTTKNTDLGSVILLMECYPLVTPESLELMIGAYSYRIVIQKIIDDIFDRRKQGFPLPVSRDHDDQSDFKSYSGYTSQLPARHSSASTSSCHPFP